MGKAKRLIGKVKDTGKAVVDKVKDKVGEFTEWWKTRKEVTTKEGEKHQLYFEGQDEKAQLMIASRPMPYRDFISQLIPNSQTQEQLKAEALAIGDSIDALKMEVVKFHKQYKDPQKDVDKKAKADEIQAKILVKMTELSVKLVPFLQNKTPEKRYLPKNFNIRVFLYINGSGFTTLSKKLRDDKAKQINKELEDIRKKDDIQRRHLSMSALRDEKLLPPDVDDTEILKNGITPSELNVDHIEPLAKHWINKGFDSSDEERNFEASRINNFKVIHESYNKSKRSEDELGIRYFYKEKPFVGKNFSSMKNKSPLGAMQIKGLNFSQEEP